jgi:hypothetical protein
MTISPDRYYYLSVKTTIYEVRALLKSVKLHSSYYLLIILVALIPGISSCGSNSPKQDSSASAATKQDTETSLLPCKIQESEKTKNIGTSPKISLVIDSSLSMLGYVKIPNSRYIQTLSLLDSIIKPKDGDKYYRLESERKQIERPGVKAEEAGFYTGTSSLIAKAFEENAKANKGGKDDQDQLIAVVTDLQPDGGDVNLIGQHIDRYLKKDGYAVAVWGIKSEFEGKVYPPNNAAAFNYSTQGKGIDKGRPFYILMAGPEVTINNLMNKVKQNGSSLLDKNSEFTLFSPSRSLGQVTYAKQLKELPNNFNTATTLKAEDGKIISGDEKRVQILELNNRAESQKLEFEFDSNTQADLIANSKIDSVLKLSSYNTEQKKFVDANDQSAFKLEPNVSKDRMGLILSLNPEKLEKGTTYYLNADLQVADAEASKNWGKWDDSNGTDGSRTKDLNKFIRNINISISDLAQDKKSTIARLCLAIQKK